MVPSPSNALSPVTIDNHQAVLWIVTVLCLIFVVITSCARGYVRLHLLGVDDWASFASTFVAVVQYAVVLAAISEGAGKASKLFDSDQQALVGRLFLASEAIAAVAIYMSKATVTLSVARLLARDMRRARVTCKTMLGFIGACGIGSLVSITAHCSASSLLRDSAESHCADQTMRWVAVTFLGGVTEIGNLAIFAWIIWPLAMKKRVKAALSSLFAFRLLCPVFSGIRTLYISHYLADADRGLAIVGPIVWQQIDMSYALLTALCLALSNFLKSFNTRMGIDMGYVASRYATGSGKATYELSSRSRNARRQRSPQKTPHGAVEGSEVRLRPESPQYMADIIHQARREPSVSSNTSQRPIIRCNVEYAVTYEDAIEEAGSNRSQ